MRILEDVFLCSKNWLQRYSMRAVKMGIMHVVVESTSMSS